MVMHKAKLAQYMKIDPMGCGVPSNDNVSHLLKHGPSSNPPHQ
jgi:hypothetical protein